MISYAQAIILGLLQGVTELFPISSLGHSVLYSSLFNWQNVLDSERSDGSFFLSFLVAMHVATAFALLLFYRQIWIRIIGGWFRTLRARRLVDDDGKLAWLLIIATIPVGLTGLLLEHKLRSQFAKPLSATIFLIINGFILLAGDRYLAKQRPQHSTALSQARPGSGLTFKRAFIIGFVQIGALLAGISRSGITMVGGLMSGLTHQDAARFSFLLATPIILAAGLLKLPDFFSNLDPSVRGQILVGSLVAGVAAYYSVKYLDRYFQTRTLRPFGIYCIGFGVFMLLVGLLRGHF